MMNIINGGAHANNSLDIQEFMILPVGAPTLSRGAALRRRGLPRAEEDPAERGLSTAVGDEGGFAPDLRLERGGARHHPRGDREGRLPGPAATSIWGSMPPARSSSSDGQLRARVREAQLHGRGIHPLPRGPGRALSDHHHRGRHERGRLGRLGEADRARWAARCSWSATICS